MPYFHDFADKKSFKDRTVLCALINIIHINPGSDYKTRGHLGSQLERKSETNLKLEKDGGGKTVIWADKNRRTPIPKATVPCFEWSNEAGMHASSATLGETKDEAEKKIMQIEATDVFAAANESVIRYGQFIKLLAEKVQVSESTAIRRLEQMTRTKIVRKELTGLYTLNA